MASAISKYRTRKSTRQCLPESRIDRRRTRMASLSQMCDTDEESESSYEESEDEESWTSASEDEQNPANNTIDSSDEEKESSCEKSKDKELKNGTTEDYNDQNPANKTTESSDDECVIRKKRLCLSNPLMESESSSDSEIYSKPVRKVKAKSRCIFVQDEESNSEEQPLDASFSVKIDEDTQLEKELAISRKRKRQLELTRLSQKKRSQSTTSSTLELTEISDEESDTSSLSQVENSSETEWENDSLKDFIVSDEKDLQTTTSNHNEFVLEKYLPNFRIRDLYSHFQRVVKALLINAFDTNFLKSLYEGRRTKKYAKEILKSLNYLDERCVDMRLTNLKSTSRWKDRYKERVDCYPNLHVKEHPGLKTSCQACELKRTCRFTVTLSGKLYDSKNLEQDSFMSNDKQVLLVGRVCSERTKVYHALKHFKYKLYEECCSIVQSEATQDENVKDAVNRIHKRLKEQSWIEERYRHFETVLNDADCFREETLE
ncbi:coiled-coil domain-containing protein 82 isoform X2 [Mobula hypostoma]|uniref:coiled-coil domain-containing protein 82 isoform X2 n=1 Tax=Mobula hypostoma TaxID=723540 RepID=UPI002FC34B18